jgi:hypothetical protein
LTAVNVAEHGRADEGRPDVWQNVFLLFVSIFVFFVTGGGFAFSIIIVVVRG